MIWDQDCIISLQAEVSEKETSTVQAKGQSICLHAETLPEDALALMVSQTGTWLFQLSGSGMW